jgi:two-component system, OmpR family, phosphate regulon sensor histidine kinase PhoR
MTIANRLPNQYYFAMPLVVIAAIAGLFVGVAGCYLWREEYLRRQLRQVLAVMETSGTQEEISLPMVSKLRRQAVMMQQEQLNIVRQSLSLQTALMHAPIGYLQLDDENQLLLCNQAAQNLLQIHNWESGQVKLLLELVRSYELDRLITKTRSSQTARELVWQFHAGYSKAVDSQSIWLKANSVPLVNGVIGVFIESQQTQIDAATARERWLADLAHEIRTPLTSMRLVAETLESRVTPNLTRWVQRMLRETNRLIDLVQHFLELSQLETTPAEYLNLTMVDAIELITAAWQTLEPIAVVRQIEFVYSGPQQLLCKLDRVRFTQVLINLFDNSIKYCPDSGHIWIEIHLSEPGVTPSQIQIDFYDDGAGFAQGDIPYIFDRLYRGDLSRQRQLSDEGNLDRQTTGSGLGLAIVRQIVLAHGGTIEARNHPTTGGAWIQVTLPDTST